MDFSTWHKVKSLLRQSEAKLICTPISRLLQTSASCLITSTLHRPPFCFISSLKQSWKELKDCIGFYSRYYPTSDFYFILPQCTHTAIYNFQCFGEDLIWKATDDGLMSPVPGTLVKTFAALCVHDTHITTVAIFIQHSRNYLTTEMGRLCFKHRDAGKVHILVP